MSENDKVFSFGINDNLAIKASAGTGKTFRLAMRFISLLHCYPELKPEQIVAITFTRKAAAEILGKIIEELLDLKKPENLKKLEALKKDGLLPQDFTPSAIPGILKRILTTRDLQISTIDSFFVKIIQAYAPEFGLIGSVEMIDENRDSSKDEMIAELIRQENKELLPLLREFAQGKDARNFTATLKEFLDDNYDTYLLYPEKTLWGNLPDVHGNLSEEELEKIYTLLNGELTCYDQQSEAGRDAVKKIQAFMKAAISGNPGTTLKKIQPIVSPDGTLYIKRGNITKDFTKLARISPEMVDVLNNTLSRHIAVLNLKLKKEKARAAYQILECYDELYAANVRSTGRLTFRDIPKLLGKIPWENKQDIEYRLDSKNLHYMLDEFQDTSTQQWAFMSNLMNEAVSGKDKAQSFFMVGDIKQSLYQWRFGNPKLFDAVCGDEIKKDTLEESRRSAPAIMAAVNDVFGEPSRGNIKNDAVRKAVERLQFIEHKTVKKDSGCVKLLQVDKVVDDDDDLRAAARATEIIKLLKKTEPFKYNRSVAILLRSNKEIARYKRCLHKIDSELPITTEGVIQPKESMACTFLTLLLRLAMHPGDAMARNALPLLSWKDGNAFTAGEIAEKLQLSRCSDYDALSDNLRILLQEAGIQGMVSRFQSAYAPELSEFDRDRLAVAAAQTVDFPGSVDEYLVTLDKLKGSGVSAEKTVQIMTIHKSKGLEFDVVFLPELGTLKGPGGDKLEIAPMKDDNWKGRGSEDLAWLKPDFISYLPVKFARESLPGIEQIYEQIKNDEIYEKVCGLYVAMTRAKRALYMFVDESAEDTGDSFRADQLLFQTLDGTQPVVPGVLYLAGTDDWYLSLSKDEEKQAKKPPNPPRAITLMALSAQRPAVPLWHSPSQHDGDAKDSSVVLPEYRFAGEDAAGLGTRIHAMLEAVKNFNSVNIEKIRAIAGEDELAASALELWEKALVPDGEIFRALTRLQGVAELWRERKFLLQEPTGNWLSGSFDRVEIVRNASGQAERAVIYDYKSDALATPKEFLERHHGQLNAYRRACSQMLNLPEERIECVILALRLGKAITVPAEQ